MKRVLRPGSPAWRRWKRLFEENDHCDFLVMQITGKVRQRVAEARREIFGAYFRSPRVRMTEDNLAELKAAIEARIPQLVMAHRFGISHESLRVVIKRYGLPRTRKDKVPRSRPGNLTPDPVQGPK